jgi:hypothetical protein
LRPAPDDSSVYQNRKSKKAADRLPTNVALPKKALDREGLIGTKPSPLFPWRLYDLRCWRVSDSIALLSRRGSEDRRVVLLNHVFAPHKAQQSLQKKEAPARSSRTSAIDSR